MVGEHAAHIGHHADDADVGNQYYESDDALNEVAQHVGGDGVIKGADSKQGQNEEKTDAE